MKLLFKKVYGYYGKRSLMTPEFKDRCTQFLIGIWNDDERVMFQTFCRYVRNWYSEMPTPEIEALMKECMETEDFKTINQTFQSGLREALDKILDKITEDEQNYP